MSRLAGKVAIITGAASGMGLSALKLFVAEGARVVATDISAEALRQAVDEVTGERRRGDRPHARCFLC